MNRLARQRSNWIALALLLITALAGSLRLYQIERLPPGLSYDEAWNDLQALRVVQGKTHPVYFVDERRDVEEPLHIYLIAGLFMITGPQATGGRVISALLGTLAIPLLFLATREMLNALHSTAPPQSDIIALLSAFVLATLYWHVHYTRLGMEPSVVPTLATLTFWLLWRAFNRSGWLDYALAGATLGLSLYSHPSARFLPFVVLVFALWRWISDRALFRHELTRFGLLVLSAALVFAPLGLFFAQNPDLFFYRAGQASVATFSGGVGPIAQNAVKVIGGLLWQGDTNLRLNLPGRPGLDVLQLLLLALGVIYALHGERRRAMVFPLLWAGIMLLPSVLSDAAPHFGRMLGATPALALLIALGVAHLLTFILAISNTCTARTPALAGGARECRCLKTEIVLAAIVAGALGYSALTMTRDYFVTWARDPGLFTAFDVGLRQSAEYLASLPRDELISFSPVDRDQPIFRFTFRDDVSRLKTFNGRRCTVYPAEPEHDFTHVAVVTEDKNSLPALERIFPSGQIVNRFFDKGQRYAAAFRVKAKTSAHVSPAAQALFDGRIALTDWELPPGATVRAGDTLPITLTWQSRAAVDVNYTLFVHLAPLPGTPPIAQEDAQPCDNSYPTVWWSPGEVIEENRRIAIPSSSVPGQYVLTTGIYDLATGTRLTMHSLDGATGDQFVLGTVTVAP
jgi:4-amino-4-deoxy-L-arabinose transferase-like glycosyltransferase